MQQPRLSRANNRRFLEITRLEQAARSQGFSKIAGVDEAGRGPLAGPVVAAACILPEDFFIPQIDDSKSLSARQREKMFAALTEHPNVHYGIGLVEAVVIDQINILQAALRAMTLAIGALKAKPDFILVDGNKKPSTEIPCQAVIRGDSLSQSIMAAAIIAKVFRDRWMSELDEQFPQYGFSSHKGYPTPEHLEALDKWGPCPLHRRSYAPVRRVAQ
jgi:ribonuclease HII